ncbi:DUF5318 domain-containing protein [Gordonia sp. PP30]|uniref:DUF5318 family protein n=1 Tax=Gordonia sp. PP30 TaxID=2935861 RepID=UPI001FFEBDF2|nr:DUF5318 family protein [Gordonia sp. PP30]UQE75013.1 DUF5318 domain-containing protein [Gordonia sp. PP30]
MHRRVVEYALAKRAKLADVRAGKTGVDEVCDADPYLLRAAQFHGVASDQSCPICRKEQVTQVSWVFGNSLGRAAGSARTPDEIARLDARTPEFSVHVVEVCRTCHWNHLIRSYVAGMAPARTTRRRAAK